MTHVYCLNSTRIWECVHNSGIIRVLRCYVIIHESTANWIYMDIFLNLYKFFAKN